MIRSTWRSVLLIVALSALMLHDYLALWISILFAGSAFFLGRMGFLRQTATLFG